MQKRRIPPTPCQLNTAELKKVTPIQYGSPHPNSIQLNSKGYTNPIWQPHCAQCCTLWQYWNQPIWQPPVLHLVANIGIKTCLLMHVASTLISALVLKCTNLKHTATFLSFIEQCGCSFLPFFRSFRRQKGCQQRRNVLADSGLCAETGTVWNAAPNPALQLAVLLQQLFCYRGIVVPYRRVHIHCLKCSKV